jgi:hypothetical protein
VFTFEFHRTFTDFRNGFELSSNYEVVEVMLIIFEMLFAYVFSHFSAKNFVGSILLLLSDNHSSFTFYIHFSAYLVDYHADVESYYAVSQIDENSA